MVRAPLHFHGRIPVPEVAPLTYRDGVTHLELVYELSQYLKNILHPSLQSTVEQVVADAEQLLSEANAQYVDGVQEFQRIHDAFMSDVNAHLIALNDGAVSDLVKDETSLLGETMREIFTDKESFDDLSGDMDFKFSRFESALTKQVTEFELTYSGQFDTNQPVSNHIIQGITENIGVEQLQQAIDDVPTGHVLTIPDDMVFDVGREKLLVRKPITIRGGRFTGERDILEVLSSNVTLQNMEFVGPGHQDGFSMSRAVVRCSGTKDEPLRNIVLKGVTVADTDGMGIRLAWVDGFQVEHCRVERYRYAGISMFSCFNGEATHNIVKHANSHASANHNCYGISVSNDQSKGYDDISKNIVLAYNTVEDNPHWEGIETHNGVNISFLFNTVKGCRRGISVGGAMQVAGAGTNNRVIGNFIDGSGASDSIHNQILGITMAGSSNQSDPTFRSAIIAMNTVLNVHKGDYVLYHGDSNTASRRYDLSMTSVFGNVFDSDPVGESTSGYHDTRWVDFGEYIEYSWGVSSWVSDPLKVRIFSTPRGREVHIKGVASRSSDLTNMELGRLRPIIRPGNQDLVFGPNGQYHIGEVYRTNGTGSAKLVLKADGRLDTTARSGNLQGNWVVNAQFLL